MLPRKRRQRAGAIKYLKRKDIVRVVEVEGVRVEGSGGVGSESAEVKGVRARGSEGWGEWECGGEGMGAGRSGSVEDEGEGAEVEGEGVDEGGDECGLPSTSEEAGRVAKTFSNRCHG